MTLPKLSTMSRAASHWQMLALALLLSAAMVSSAGVGSVARKLAGARREAHAEGEQRTGEARGAQEAPAAAGSLPAVG